MDIVNGDDWADPGYAGYAYEIGSTPTQCRSCGADIMWAVHATSGKRMPIDRDGTSHFATCPQADKWRKR